MNNAVSRYVIERVARHLPAVDENVVTPTGLCVDAQFAEHQRHEVDVAVEGEVHLFVACDVGEHDVRHVGIHTPASAFAAKGGNAVLETILQVDFCLDDLVATEDDTRFHLPHEKTVVVRVQMASNVFLQCKIEAQLSGLMAGERYVNHSLFIRYFILVFLLRLQIYAFSVE